jgi:hypothetical protein
MKNAVLWDVTTRGSCKNRRFGGSMLRLQVTASVVHRSLNLGTLRKVAILSSESSILTRATWRNIPQDDILQLLA